MSSNQRDVRGRISEKKRKSCCVTGLRNLGPLARVSLVRHEGEIEGKKEAEEHKDAGNDRIDNSKVIKETDVAGGGIFDCDSSDSDSDSKDSNRLQTDNKPALPKRPL